MEENERNSNAPGVGQSGPYLFAAVELSIFMRPNVWELVRSVLRAAVEQYNECM